jgi:small-conductance mechanosensitive channel
MATLSAVWSALLGILGAELFSIGSAPVTTIGLLRVVAAITLAVIASRAVRSALTRLTARWPGMEHSSLYALGRVAHYTLLTLGFVIGLATIGVDFTNLAVLVGALGVGIGFGLQDTVANFIAGLVILFERHLRVGDFIELESGVAGEVRDVRMRATRITTNDNIDILVPNSEFVRGRVVNWTLDEAHRRIHVPFGVSYGNDKDTVRAAALEAAERTPHTLKGIQGREPQVWLVRFGDSSLDFELVVWLTSLAVKKPFVVPADYLWELHSAFERHNIEIPFPQQDVHVRSLFGLERQAARDWIHSARPPTT